MTMQYTKRKIRNVKRLQCTKCKEIKSICEFYVRYNLSYTSRCKSCLSIIKKEYYATKRKRKVNKHGYMGVVYYASRDLYYARIGINGKVKFLGKAATAAEAGQIYQEAVQKYRGI